MKLIETKTLATGQSSIEFTDIPQDFTDLFILLSARGSETDAASGHVFFLGFNGSTSNFSWRNLDGTGSAARSANAPNSVVTYVVPSEYTANTFSNNSLYIPNYTGSTYKSVSHDGVTENNATASYQAIEALLWSNTAAITSISLDPPGNFIAGTTVSLYGIGPDARTTSAKATGGTIYRSGDYWVHEFTSSGTFTPTTALTNVEYLVVAGGGGGSSGADRASGGGGAGGYRSSVVGESSGGGGSAESRLSLTSGTPYTVTVGAGGAPGSVPSTITANSGSNGSNSVFGSISSNGGGGGGGANIDAITGGAGGGGYGSGGWNGLGGNAGSGTANQGFNGGQGFSSTATGNEQSGGGGGGAGAVGANGSASAAGAGGNGVASSITGTSIVRGGGGGGDRRTGSAAAGGTGGGGAGAVSNNGTSGTANTGGGGGAGTSTLPATPGKSGGTGGSGIVIVRYAA